MCESFERGNQQHYSGKGGANKSNSQKRMIVCQSCWNKHKCSDVENEEQYVRDGPGENALFMFSHEPILEIGIHTQNKVGCVDWQDDRREIDYIDTYKIIGCIQET